MKRYFHPSLKFVVSSLLVILLVFVAGCSKNENKNIQTTPTKTKNILKRHKLKVLVIGVDGVAPNLFDKFLAKGKLPNLASILKEGSRANVHTEFILSSPVIWTSLATGVVPKIHGITNFTINGKPLNSSFRKVPAFWNIFPLYNIKAATLAWWATWPAEKNAGIMIGSRVFWKERPNKVYPPHIIDTDKYAMANFIDNYNFLPRFTNYHYEPNYKEKFAHGSNAFIVNKLIRQRLIKIYYGDKIYTDIAVKLAKENDLDVLSIYLEGVDYVSHAFWKYMEPKTFRDAGFKVKKEEVASLGGIIPKYYQYTDELIGRLLTLCDKDTYIFVLSDHGFGADPSLLVNDKKLGISGNHRPDTLFILSGPEIVKHKRFGTITPQHQADFLPTLFYLLDIPLAKQFAGKPQTQFFTEKFQSNRKIRYVDAYPKLHKQELITPTQHQENKVLKDLRGLGYIK